MTTEIAGSPVFLKAEGHATTGAPLCGKHDIQPLFYALDMMLPVIALQEETKCQVTGRAGTEIWQVLWSVFSFVGKLVTSLALLTYSGILKQTEES